jgi:hypothetical protein
MGADRKNAPGWKLLLHVQHFAIHGDRISGIPPSMGCKKICRKYFSRRK